MRQRIGALVAMCFYYSGLVKLARSLRRRSGQCLIILNYHRAIGGDLRRHLLYLRHHYQMLHLEEALERLFTPCDGANRQRDRRTPLVLVFGDGYHDNYTHAFVLAQELQVPITIFLIPGYVQSGDYFWWQEGKRLTHRAMVDKVIIEGCTYSLKQAKERALLSEVIDAHLRYATSVAKREEFLAQVREALAVPPTIAEKEESTLPLTWSEIHTMEESGWVSFGAHTMHHPILSCLTALEEIHYEVGECRSVLERELGHPIRAFAYPIGKLEQIGDQVLKSVQVAEYDWALTTIHGINTPASDPRLLRRISGDVSRHWAVMAAEVAGVWKFFSLLWKNALFRER